MKILINDLTYLKCSLFSTRKKLYLKKRKRQLLFGGIKMKKYVFVVCLILFILLTGCSKDELPTERLETYLDLWGENNFSAMYDMLSNEAEETYSTEDFVDRYEKVYDDLEIENLQLSYDELSDEQEKEAIEKGIADFTLHVEMESMAGPIEFSEDVQLRLQEDKADEELKQWYIEWNPDLIFPHLADGGKIRIETEHAKRGEILDRNQMPLAINDIAYEIGVVPNLFENEEREKQQIAELLHMSVEAIDDALNASWVEEDHFVPLKTIPKTDKDLLAKLLDISAVTSVDTEGRTYPSSKSVAHLTGYVGEVTAEDIENNPEASYRENDVIGKRGLEQLYDKQLRGEDGVKIFIEKKDGDEVNTITLAEKPVTPGEHVQVTIDINIQEKIFNEYGDKAGTAAAINPKTGEILALVSSPAFDPNELTYGISQDRWDALMEDKKQPFVNRFAATFAPGSVIKPITASIGLANGTTDPEKGIKIDGLTWSKDGWGDFKVRRVSTTEKPVDLRTALVRSDNIYFAKQAVEMGASKFTDGLKEFGVGDELPLSYPFSKSQISNSGNLKDEILLANTSYGQGEIELSALHLALAYTPFINEGNMMKPSLLTDDKKGEVWKENMISKEDAKLIKTYLREVVTDGTAKAANNEEIAISGKTGTAELKVSHDTKGHENGWFIGYPTDDPDILIAMMMESVEDVGSSSFVAEKVADILKEIK